MWTNMWTNMDHNPHTNTKRARARRMILRREKIIKRLKTTPLSNVNGRMTYTPKATSLRCPLADITTSVTNQKTVEQVVAEGEALSAMFDASLPRPSYHCCRSQKRCSNL